MKGFGAWAMTAFRFSESRPPRSSSRALRLASAYRARRASRRRIWRPVLRSRRPANPQGGAGASHCDPAQDKSDKRRREKRSCGPIVRGVARGAAGDRFRSERSALRDLPRFRPCARLPRFAPRPAPSLQGSMALAGPSLSAMGMPCSPRLPPPPDPFAASKRRFHCPGRDMIRNRFACVGRSRVDPCRSARIWCHCQAQDDGFGIQSIRQRQHAAVSDTRLLEDQKQRLPACIARRNGPAETRSACDREPIGAAKLWEYSRGDGANRGIARSCEHGIPGGQWREHR